MPGTLDLWRLILHPQAESSAPAALQVAAAQGARVRAAKRGTSTSSLGVAIAQQESGCAQAERGSCVHLVQLFWAPFFCQSSSCVDATSAVQPPAQQRRPQRRRPALAAAWGPIGHALHQRALSQMVGCSCCGCASCQRACQATCSVQGRPSRRQARRAPGSSCHLAFVSRKGSSRRASGREEEARPPAACSGPSQTRCGGRAGRQRAAASQIDPNPCNRAPIMLAFTTHAMCLQPGSEQVAVGSSTRVQHR